LGNRVKDVISTAIALTRSAVSLTVSAVLSALQAFAERAAGIIGARANTIGSAVSAVLAFTKTGLERTSRAVVTGLAFANIRAITIKRSFLVTILRADLATTVSTIESVQASA